MVLQTAITLAARLLPSGYYWPIFVSLAVGVVTYAFAQGRTTNRDRDLHARTILVTGAFSPTGLTLISNLASRGAHIIALSEYPLEDAQPSLLIPALRETTKNPNIYAEYADLTSPVSIREFCTKFLTGDDQRLDAIVYAHEYACIGSLFGSTKQLQEKRHAASLATFLLTTLLLPALLVAPVERDIRIVHLVNPFYAAASRTFTPELVASMSGSPGPQASEALFLREGYRALRTVVLARHLQRILNALPNRAPTLDPQFPAGVAPEGSSPAEASQPNASSAPPGQQKFPSNIVAVSACPGVNRSEVIRGVLGLEAEDRSLLLLIMYLSAYPIIWLMAKSSSMAVQTVLHALFLPSPFKRALAHLTAATDHDRPTKAAAIIETETVTEVLKPGALYRECSVVTLNVPPLPEPPKPESAGEKSKGKQKEAGGRGKEADGLPEFDLEEDGEYGGEGVGRVVWEWYETRLKTWEAQFKSSGSAATDTDSKPPVAPS